jgi:DNA-binding MarR family transcriptional regulator
MIVQADYRAAMGPDLPTRVFSALSLVVQFPNITQSKLAKTLGIERSGLVAIIDELEAQGYLSRTHVPGDRRVQALVPTTAGKTAYEEACVKVRAHEARVMEALSAEEQKTLFDLLTRIRLKPLTEG